jgi:N-acyl-D-amino-acid deacylase
MASHHCARLMRHLPCPPGASRSNESMRTLPFVAVVLGVLLAGCAGSRPSMNTTYELLLRHGTIYDGSGGAPFVADVAVEGDRIVAVGDLSAAKARREVDCTGMAVAPGFINMLGRA